MLYKGVPVDHYDRFMMDAPLRSSIENFQRKKGLKIDGVLLPKGETEEAINSSLSKREKNDEGACTFKNFGKKAIELQKVMSSKHPVRQSSNAFLDNTVLKKIPVVGRYLAGYNTGYSIGQKTAIAKVAYDETCRKAKK